MNAWVRLYFVCFGIFVYVAMFCSMSRIFAGIDTIDRELARLAADLERDIGKVYRKYERIERVLRSARDKKLAERDQRFPSSILAFSEMIMSKK